MKSSFSWLLLRCVPAVVYANPSNYPDYHGALAARESVDSLLGTRAPSVSDLDCPLSCPNGKVCVFSFTRGPICTTDKGYPPKLRRPIYVDGGNSSASAQDLRRDSSPEKRNPLIIGAMKVLGGAILDQALGFALGSAFDSIFGGGDDNAALIEDFREIAREIVAEVKDIVHQEISAAWQNRDEDRVIGILNQIDAIPDANIPTENSDLSKFGSFDRDLRNILFDQGLGSLDQTIIFLKDADYTIHVAPFFLLAASAHIGLELELIRSAKLWAAKGGPDHTTEYINRIKREAKGFADHMETLQAKAVSLIKTSAVKCLYQETDDLVHSDSFIVYCKRWATVDLPGGGVVTFRGPYNHVEVNGCTGLFGACTNGDKSKTRRHCKDRSSTAFCGPLQADGDNIAHHFLWHGPHGPMMLSPEWKYVFRYFRHIQSNGGIDTFDTDCWTNNPNSANPFPGV